MTISKASADLVPGDVIAVSTSKFTKELKWTKPKIEHKRVVNVGSRIVCEGGYSFHVGNIKTVQVVQRIPLEDICEICEAPRKNCVEREGVILCQRHATPLHIWTLPPLLPAPEQPLMLPAKTGISIGDKVMIGETQHEIRHYGGEIYTRYNSRVNLRYEVACYTQAQIAVFNGGIARPDETAKRAQATLCPPPELRRSMYTSQREIMRKKAEEMAATMPRRNATQEEIKSILSVSAQQAKTTKKHNAVRARYGNQISFNAGELPV